MPERAGLDPTHTRDVFYAYDIGDRMTLARFDSLSGQGVTNSYDGFGRLLSSRIAMDGHNFTVASAYDAAGNRIQVTYGGQSYVYAYDAASRLTQIREGSATGTLLAQFSYTPQGQVDLRSDGSAASSIDYSYDPIGRLSGQSHSFPDLIHDVAYGYAYNPAGQLHSRTRSNDLYAWSGDRSVDETYGVNGLNQYVHVDGAPQGYDANGNLTSDGSTSYAYDVENRLVAASGVYNGNLRYDPLGRLWEISVASGIRRLVWDSRTPSGDALVVEYHGTGSLAARYVHGAGAGDDPLVWRGGGLNRRLHADHLGSIVAITDPSGAVVAINTYDEWGRPGSIVGRFGFTGQLWIGELGLNYYKARMYSPRGGRFMQVDPVGYDDQINLYAHVGNDPVNRTDPDGQQSESLMDRRYVYPHLSPEQVAGLEEQHDQIGDHAATGMLIGAVLTPVGRGIGWAGAWVGRLVGIFRGAPTVSRATQVALNGGPNASLVRQFADRSTTSLNRTVRSLTRRIEEHQARIRDPASHMTRESARDPAAVRRAVRDWQKEIRNYSDQRDIARDMLRSRGTCTGTRICW